MSFSNVTKDNNPVKEAQTVHLCSSFTGKLSSETGIIAKGLYIAKIDPETGEPSFPTVRIICGTECVDKCKNISKKKESNFKLIE